MISGLIASLQSEASDIARRTGFRVGGAIFLLLAVLCFSAAGWLYLANRFDPLTAWLVTGGLFVLLGAVFFFLGRHRRSGRLHGAAQAGTSHSTGRSDQALGLIAVVEAFMIGFSSGRRKK